MRVTNEQYHGDEKNGGDMKKTKARNTHSDRVGMREHKGHEFDCVVCHWVGPKSMCACGHPGDGDNSAHAGAIGHGECLLCPAGKCRKFTWGGFYDSYQSAMDSVLVKKAR